MLLSESFVRKVKDVMSEGKIEVPDSDYWTTEVFVIAFNHENVRLFLLFSD